MNSPNPKLDSTSKRAAMLALKVFGGASWIYAYKVATDNSRTSRELFLPPTAIAFNLVWEATYSAGGVVKWKSLTLEDRVQTILNLTWFAMDLKWVSVAKQSGHHLKPGIMAAAVAYQLAFLAKYEPADAARRSALLQNLAFSAYTATQDTSAYDPLLMRFTVSRAIGTAVPTLTSGLLRGYRPMYLLPGLGCVIFDAIRVWRVRWS